jgi:hypothetical protein
VALRYRFDLELFRTLWPMMRPLLNADWPVISFGYGKDALTDLAARFGWRPNMKPSNFINCPAHRAGIQNVRVQRWYHNSANC